MAIQIKIPDWREREDSIEKVIEHHPDVPIFTILKTDLHRRGYVLSAAARAKIDVNIHHTNGIHLTGESDSTTVEGLVLRDGTLVCNGCVSDDEVVLRDPYLIDVDENDRIVITDQGRIYEEAEFWRKPDYYDKVTSKGTPMWKVANVRGKRIDSELNKYCEFWDTPGDGCKYCGIGVYGVQEKKCGHQLRVDPDDLAETLQEALKQKGRFLQFNATQGSLLGGAKLLDDELELCLDSLVRIKKLFSRFPLKASLVTTALDGQQLERLRDEGGIGIYTANIEVLNKELFQWICPGKARHIGYDGWKGRLEEAVSIFGKGNVYTDIIGGLELATPHGFKTEDEALESELKEADLLSQKGIQVVDFVWRVYQNTIFKNQVSPSLDYYVRLSQGISALHDAYGLNNYSRDYARSGNQPSGDLDRIRRRSELGKIG
jgi:hypothetical protein